MVVCLVFAPLTFYSQLLALDGIGPKRTRMIMDARPIQRYGFYGIVHLRLDSEFVF
jgi:hypothetical protein